MKKRSLLAVFCLVAGTVGLTGCATSSQVDEKIAASESRSQSQIDSVEGQVEAMQKKQREMEEQLSRVSREAGEALKRADAAGVLAKGKVVFEESFSEDKVRFKLESADLTDEAKGNLDMFAAKVKDLNRPVWIEIQGHTDSTGSDSYNEKLGQDRAESVRRHLAMAHGLPLVRMSTISYGEALPATDNGTREGRQQNRRVVLIVLE